MSIRINRYIAQATGLSRRAADAAIQDGRVAINGSIAQLGDQAQQNDTITLDGKPVSHNTTRTILLHKPVGYVCSRDGQGSQTIYDLLPPEHHDLKSVGRLDKDSSGLLLLTNDGQLAHQLTHPGFRKKKVYEVELNQPLTTAHQKQIEQGIELDDGLSLMRLEGAGKQWRVTIYEGRNRQIRRTFEALSYHVQKLHRTHFGDYRLANLSRGEFKLIMPKPSS